MVVTLYDENERENFLRLLLRESCGVLAYFDIFIDRKRQLGRSDCNSEIWLLHLANLQQIVFL